VLFASAHLLAIATLCVFAALAYQHGRQTSGTLESASTSLVESVGLLHGYASELQSVVNGTQPVAGEFISDAFLPGPPLLTAHSEVCFRAVALLLEVWYCMLMHECCQPLQVRSSRSPMMTGGLIRAQVMTTDLGRVDNISGEVHQQLESAYDGFLALVVVNVLLSASTALLALVAFSCGSGKLRVAALMLLPLSGILLWITGAVTFALWISARDICNASSDYISISPAARLDSQVSMELVPCAHYLAANDLAGSGRQMYTDLMQRANTLITGTCCSRLSRLCVRCFLHV
jgi:hypothetical protein